MPGQEKSKRPPSQAILASNMWGLPVCKSFLEDRDNSEGLDGCLSSKYLDQRPFLPDLWLNSEGSHDYRPGGLHPIHIEDSLDCGRYTVIHKLGHGVSSTVWLARDGTLNKYVSIKILTAEVSKIRNELGCLQYLSSKPCSQHPGQEYISASFLYRHFWLDGPNSRHLVLVSKVSGPRVALMTEWYIQIRESLARKIALQVTQGLAYLHSEGICHGKLTSSDVLFQLADFNAWSQEKVYEQLGIPTVLDLDEWSGVPFFPRYLVDSAQFFRASPGLLTEDIRIIGYGDSFRVGWPNLSTNLRLRQSGFIAPENPRGLKFTRSLDLWAFGCIIYEIRAGRPLFVNVIPMDAIFEIKDLLGSDQSNQPGPEFHGDEYPDLNGKSKVTDESTKEQIFQVVAEIKDKPRANSEGAMIETRELEEARNNSSQIRPYIKSDPNLFWKPLPSAGIPIIDTLFREWSEICAERDMWVMENPLPNISSTEAEQLSNLLRSVLSYLPKKRKAAARLAKHSWFVEPVKLEASGNGKSQKVSKGEGKKPPEA